MKAVVAALSLTVLALAGCATQPPSFVANVTTLAEPIPAIPSRGVYRFASVSPEQAGSLEYRAVRDAVAIGLTRVGMIPANLAPGAPARLVVAFDYDTQPFQTWTETATLSPWYGMGWGGSYWGPGWGMGFWGPPPVVYQPMPTQGWRYTLMLSIRQASDDVEIYNVKATHESLSDNSLEVLPYLVEAALEGYPAAGNHTREVRLPMGRR